MVSGEKGEPRTDAGWRSLGPPAAILALIGVFLAMDLITDRIHCEAELRHLTVEGIAALFALGGATDGTGGADHNGCDYTTGAAIEVCASFGHSARVSALPRLWWLLFDRHRPRDRRGSPCRAGHRQAGGLAQAPEHRRVDPIEICPGAEVWRGAPAGPSAGIGQPAGTARTLAEPATG